MPLTANFVKEIHKIGFSWIFPELGGKFRTIEVTVSKHIPPKFFLIPQLTEDFMKDLQIRIKNLPKIEDENFLNEFISLLAWSHHRFLWIHPFKDYNGRIARLFNNIILLNLNLPPIELKVETKSGRRKYIEALQSADKHDYSQLEKIIKSAIEEATQELQK